MLANNLRVILVLVLAALCFLLSVLPLVGAVGKPWPGFFYSPFYTTNVFTDASLPAQQAGLRPEDRVIQAGALPGQWPRIERLTEQTRLAAAQNHPLTLVYELGRDLVTIPVKVELLDWLRLLEKAGPLFLTGGLLFFAGLTRPNNSLAWQIFVFFSALALLAAPDYFLNAGNGRESGFLPDISNGLATSAKWSTFLYMPLWKIALTAGAIFYLQTIGNLQLATRNSQLPPPDHRQLFFQSLVIALLIFDLISYSYEAIKTAIYNNPDYVVWQGRTAFWPEWGGLTLLLVIGEIRRRGWKALLPIAGYVLFLGGFIIPTVFDLTPTGSGPQWYSLGLLLYFTTQNLKLTTQ